MGGSQIFSKKYYSLSLIISVVLMYFAYIKKIINLTKIQIKYIKFYSNTLIHD